MQTVIKVKKNNRDIFFKRYAVYYHTSRFYLQKISRPLWEMSL